MFKSLLKDRMLLSLLALSLLIKLFSLNEGWVEEYYTYGVYPFISKLLRIFFGWIPFSIGDLLYIAAFIFIVIKVWKLLHTLIKRRWKEKFSMQLFSKYLKLVLWIYIIFNIFWGLNYNRQGIANQLGLEAKAYTLQELQDLTGILHQRLNFYAAQIDSVKRARFDNNKTLFAQAVRDYKKIKEIYPFLAYRFSSIKPSLYGASGKYFGYTGYYNPFTAEAQLKTSIPVFYKPYIANHEIAHQLGYAKENEASFISYLVTKNSNSVEFRYSIYYNLYYSASGRFVRDVVTKPGSKKPIRYIIHLNKTLHPRIITDLFEAYNYSKTTRNMISPYMNDAYDIFLKLNNQPKGMATYNEVIALLIAYMKKYGKKAI